ncbi:hypothetical protein RJ639_018335, partial [Escallonia herrerae]
PTYQVIQPINGDPFIGSLETPVTSSPLIAWYLSNLPAYRTAVSPLLRGIEVGLAHGFLLVGPFVKAGPLRNTEIAGPAGSLAAGGLVVILSLCLTMYGIASFKEGDPSVAPALTLTGRKKVPDQLQTADGWAKFTGGFFFGGISGVTWAYFLLYVLNLPYYVNKPLDYLLDAPVSVGDGFSFSGGKYSDGNNPADEWFKKGNILKAHPVCGTGGKAKDPIFGLTMGGSSQASTDVFRWFYIESGSADNPPIILIHGFPSQAYSYRKAIPILSKNYHAIAFDWLGFGFSDKPQPKYGFDYTLGEYVSSLESLINELAIGKVSLVVQGYFAPVVVKYASSHQEKLNDLILLNPPDPLRASDKALTSSGPYKMKEDDAMVYRRPYLTSGSSGFALNAISREMKKDLKTYVEEMRMTLMDASWKVRTTICWGQRDRWLSYDGVEEFCNNSKHRLVELPTAGHHVQEDLGEELGKVISGIISKRR